MPSSKHPLYSEHLTDWIKMRHTYQGERVVKEQLSTYLPVTGGMKEDGWPTAGTAGTINYLAYVARARFPNYLKSAVESLLGILHRREPKYTLPEKMQPLLEHCTCSGEPLSALHRKVNEHQLRFGRVGVLADLPPSKHPGVAIPQLSIYDAESIINWDDNADSTPAFRKLQFVVLEESVDIRDGFSWSKETRHRILDASSGVYSQRLVGPTVGDYNITPLLGNNSLDELPFVIINSKDLVSAPDEPPLLGLADLSLTVYRTEADYRTGLFLQGQDTLVVEGGDSNTKYRTGAGATLVVPIGAKAEFIGVDSQGLSELRQAISDDGRNAAIMGAQLIDTTSRSKESGSALGIRVSAQTATLNQIALTGATGLQNILRTVATWLGEDPASVIVEPNLDFSGGEIDGRSMVDMITAKTMGYPITLKDLHETAKRRGLTQNTYEETLTELEGEPELGSVPVDPNPTGFNQPGGGDGEDD